MSAKPYSGNGKNNRHPLGAAEVVMLILAVLFLLPGILIFGWYGRTYLTVRQVSSIPARQAEISFGDRHCTLDIAGGELSIRRPERTSVGSSYKLDASVDFIRPLRFVSCSGGLPNWNISLEAQTTLVGASVNPFASIRQPAFDRDHFIFAWTFVPEEEVAPYTSHLWLRAVISEQDQIIDRWDILVRDFPMENSLLFGQAAIFWLIGGGFAILTGLLILILFLQKRRKFSSRERSEND